MNFFNFAYFAWCYNSFRDNIGNYTEWYEDYEAFTLLIRLGILLAEFPPVRIQIVKHLR